MLLNLIKYQQTNSDKIYLYVKDPFESKYQILINRKEKLVTEKLKIPKTFIDYSQQIHYQMFMKDYNPTKKKDC